MTSESFVTVSRNETTGDLFQEIFTHSSSKSFKQISR
jgi:hypothetical protein